MADAEKYVNYTQNTTVKEKKIVDAPYHSTLCSTCQSVCHDQCGLAEITTKGMAKPMQPAQCFQEFHLCIHLLCMVSACQCLFRGWEFSGLWVLHSSDSTSMLSLALMQPTGDPNFGNCSCFSGGNGKCQQCTGNCGVSVHYHARKTIKEVAHLTKLFTNKYIVIHALHCMQCI